MAKLTPKREAFALAYVETSNASEAYRRAFGVSEERSEWVKIEASRLLRDPNVALTVAAIRTERRNQAAVTAASLTEELEEARALAVQEKQTAAAVSATMGKAKINGLIVDKKELGGFDGKPIGVEVNDTSASTRDLAKAILALISKAENET